MEESAFTKLIKTLHKLGWVAAGLLAIFVIYGYTTVESWVSAHAAKAFTDPATNAAITQYIDNKVRLETEAQNADLKRVEGKVDHLLEGLGEIRGELRALQERKIK